MNARGIESEEVGGLDGWPKAENGLNAGTEEGHGDVSPELGENEKGLGSSVLRVGMRDSEGVDEGGELNWNAGKAFSALKLVARGGVDCAELVASVVQVSFLLLHAGRFEV